MPKRLPPPQPNPATLTFSPVFPSAVYSNVLSRLVVSGNSMVVAQKDKRHFVYFMLL